MRYERTVARALPNIWRKDDSVEEVYVDFTGEYAKLESWCTYLGYGGNSSLPKPSLSSAVYVVERETYFRKHQCEQLYVFADH